MHYIKGPGRKLKSVSTEHHKRNPRKLIDSDLWQISSSMNAINWRALGNLVLNMIKIDKNGVHLYIILKAA